MSFLAQIGVGWDVIHPGAIARLPRVLKKELVTIIEVAERIGVHRTTLSRWKKEGSVPPGQWFPRGKQVLYTPSEVHEIEAFAFRLEPIGEAGGIAADAHERGT